MLAVTLFPEKSKFSTHLDSIIIKSCIKKLEAYKTIGEVAKIVDLIDKKKGNSRIK